MMSEADFDDLPDQIVLAQRGDSDAQLILAARLATGRGIRMDQLGAMYWYAQAAEQGNIQAKWEIGLMLLKGEGGLADKNRQGIELILEAATEGEQSACEFLALCYESGAHGLNQSAEKEEYWKNQSALSIKSNRAIGKTIDFESLVGVSLVKPMIQLD